MNTMRSFSFAAILGVSACMGAVNIAHAQGTGGQGGGAAGGGAGGESGSPMKAMAFVNDPKGKQKVPVDVADPSYCTVYFRGDALILCRLRRQYE